MENKYTEVKKWLLDYDGKNKIHKKNIQKEKVENIIPKPLTTIQTVLQTSSYTPYPETYNTFPSFVHPIVKGHLISCTLDRIGTSTSTSFLWNSSTVRSSENGTQNGTQNVTQNVTKNGTQNLIKGIHFGSLLKEKDLKDYFEEDLLRLFEFLPLTTVLRGKVYFGRFMVMDMEICDTDASTLFVETPFVERWDMLVKAFEKFNENAKHENNRNNTNNIVLVPLHPVLNKDDLELFCSVLKSAHIAPQHHAETRHDHLIDKYGINSAILKESPNAVPYMTSGVILRNTETGESYIRKFEINCE